MTVVSVPIRCYSSQWTGTLIYWRNPQKDLLDQVFNEEKKISNYFTHVGKILVTEVGSLGLIFTSGVEWFGYEVISIGSLFAKAETREHYRDLCASSRFTLLWNLTNFVFFNWCCTNLFSEETIARYAIDYVHAGLFATLIAVVAVTTVTLLSFKEKWDIFSYLARGRVIIAVPAIILLKNLHHLFSPTHIRDQDTRFLAAMLPLENCHNQSLHGRIVTKLQGEAAALNRWQKIIRTFFDTCKPKEGLAIWLKMGHRMRLQELAVMHHLHGLLQDKGGEVEFWQQATIDTMERLRKISLTSGQKAFLDNHFKSYPPTKDKTQGNCDEILTQLEFEALKYVDKPHFRQAWDWVCDERGYA